MGIATTKNFKKIVEGRRKMADTKKKKLQISIDDAFDFRDRPKPVEVPVNPPGKKEDEAPKSTADAFTKSFRGRLGKKKN